jgi:hypothetical protein
VDEPWYCWFVAEDVDSYKPAVARFMQCRTAPPRRWGQSWCPKRRNTSTPWRGYLPALFNFVAAKASRRIFAVLTKVKNDSLLWNSRSWNPYRQWSIKPIICVLKTMNIVTFTCDVLTVTPLSRKYLVQWTLLHSRRLYILMQTNTKLPQVLSQANTAKFMTFLLCIED